MELFGIGRRGDKENLKIEGTIVEKKKIALVVATTHCQSQKPLFIDRFKPNVGTTLSF